MFGSHFSSGCSRHSCCEPAYHGHGCHPGRHHHHHDPHHPSDEPGAFGVRRPLRFLAWKLQLDRRQVEELAAILNDLKTERAQSAVDDRRALAMLADAVQGESFDQARAKEAAEQRGRSSQRLQESVVRSLERIHGLLEPEQRARFAYMLRTGTVAL